MTRPAPIGRAPSGAALWRATIAHAPASVGDAETAEIFGDGGLLLDDSGGVRAVGSFERLRSEHPTVPVEDRRGSWIFPGFVDLHVHFPQIRVVGSRGAALLDWLDRYVFPEEARFSDETYAAAAAETFCDLLLRAGTTTALVFGSHDARATELCFKAAERRGLRIALGKTLHGEGVPPSMLDRPKEARDQCRALISDWHGRGKARFAITPRFALTSTPDVFALCRELAAATPGLLLTTHVSENDDETARTGAKFPEARDYVDVYDREGLLGATSIFAHGVKLNNRERGVLAAKQAALAHCPSSNFFLGSGVMDFAAANAAGVRVGLGTDVGAGTSLSLLAETSDAYKASALRGRPLSPGALLRLATSAGAEILGLQGVCGAFTPGARGDFVVIDPARDPLLQTRLDAATDPQDRLFAILVLARGGCVAETAIDGAVVSRAPKRV